MSSALTDIEIASGAVTGGNTADAPEVGQCAMLPIVALEQALLPALCRSPCLISFSGGKDSSLLLALAVQIARREGLPAPLPVTWRFTHAPRADESHWQDDIIRELGIADWEVRTADDELDIIAPTAQEMLRRYGVRYPANLNLHQPIIESAAGGSVITGLGGDQVLTCWFQASSGSARRLSTARRRIPSSILAAGRSRRARSERPWLLPAAAATVQRQVRRDAVTQPRDPVGRLAWRLARRHLVLTRASCDDLASDHDVRIHHPLLDPTFHAALCSAIPLRVNLTRSELISRIGHDRVPSIVHRRTTKAWFREVFVGRPSREFASRWDGSGVDGSLVDARALRELWSRWPIPSGTDLLLQQLWLQRDRAVRQVARSDR